MILCLVSKVSLFINFNDIPHKLFDVVENYCFDFYSDWHILKHLQTLILCLISRDTFK